MSAGRTSASAAIAVCVAVVILACPSVSAKGSFGSPRASGGGYIRGAKSGVYSRHTRFVATGMYWNRGGYYYSGTRGSSAGAAQPGDPLTDIMCTRHVMFDKNSTALTQGSRPYVDFSRGFSLVTTRRCVREVVAQPGNPANLEYTGLMLDRYFFHITMDPYPTIKLVVVPDRDLPVKIVNTTWRFTTVTTNTATYDLSQFSWTGCKPSLTNKCVDSAERGFMLPATYFLDMARVYHTGIRGVDPKGGVVVNLDFHLADDFAEDPADRHIFMLPSMMQVFVTVSGAGSKVQLSTILVGKGDAHYIPVTPSAAQVAEYSPRRMNRVEFGTTQQQMDGFGSLLSWWPQQVGQICQTLQCMWSSVTSTTQLRSSATSACTNNDGSAQCQNIFDGTGNQKAYHLTFTENTSGASTWYFHFGYWDPAQATVPYSTAAPARFASTVAMCLCVAMLALL